MTEKSDVRREQAIVWKTEIPNARSRKVSPVFSLLGATWQLEMELSIPSLNSSSGCYGLHLRRIGNSAPTAHFSVITIIQGIETFAAGMTYGSQKVNIIETVSKLWMCGAKITYQSSVGVSFGGGLPEIIHSNKEVTAVCVFTDIPGATCVGLNETDVNLDSLSRDLGKLLEDKVIPDVNLKCGDQTVAAHKAILAARSQVFSAMFKSKMLESEIGVVDIADIDAQVLEIFLRYLYSGMMPDVPEESLPSLYAAADKYAVNALKRACSERMINNLKQENCLNILILANAHSDQDFKNVIFNFLLNHTEILKSQEWTRFCMENPFLSIEVLQTVVQQKCL